jgi:tRNA threonylcarbamoyladenosine biosynthesis protein TsaB
MNYLLHIDTASDTASICLSENEEVLELVFNESRNDHAAWLHTAIDALLKKNEIKVKDLQAIAVAIGPGSYTGLRVALSAAKGLCYALNIPLIAVSTLSMLAYAVLPEVETLICPVIDARRMEVFTTVYDKNLQEVLPPQALIIDESSFLAILDSNKVVFCGSGCKKLQPVINHSNATFSTVTANASHLVKLAHPLFEAKQFADTAYAEPFYIKEFFTAFEGKK